MRAHAARAQRLRQITQGPLVFGAEQGLGRMRSIARRRRQRHAALERARDIGQLDLDALVEHGREPCAGLVAPALRDELRMIALQRRIAQDRGMETAQHVGAMVGQVLDQLHIGLQSELAEQLQRRCAQQLREPRVKRADLYRVPAAQDALMQARQLRRQRAGLGRRDAPLHQCLDARCIARARRGELAQPLGQACAHLACGLARERDREYFLRLGALEQRAQDARDQHPGLARAGAGLDDDAAPRVAGNRVEGRAIDRRAVRLVGRDPHHGAPR